MYISRGKLSLSDIVSKTSYKKFKFFCRILMTLESTKGKITPIKLLIDMK